MIEPLIQRVCKVAGYEVPTPFPRLTYAQAMRSYGIDKPDLRLPPFHCVEDLFPGAGLTRGGPAAGGDSHSQDRRSSAARSATN